MKKDRIIKTLFDFHPVMLFLYFLASLFANFVVEGRASLLETNSLFAMGFKVLSFAFLLFIVFITVLHTRVFPSPSLVFLALLICVFGSMAIWFPNQPNSLLGVDGITMVEYSPSLSVKINGEVSLLRFFVAALYFVGVFPRIVSKEGARLFSNLLIAFSFFCLAYVAVFQRESLFSSSYSSSASSIFSNKNAFGFVLYASSLVCFFYVLEEKWIYSVFQIVFFASAVITYCRTAAVIIGIHVICLPIILAFKYFKKSKFIFACSISFLSAVILLASFLAFLVTTSFLDGVPFLDWIKKTLLKFIDTLLSSTESSRITIWRWTFTNLLNGPAAFLGYGPNVANYALSCITSVAATALGHHSIFHNFFVETLATGGVVRLLLTFVIVYLFALKNQFLTNRNTVIRMRNLVLWTTIILYQFSEAIQIISSNGLPMFFTIFYFGFLNLDAGHVGAVQIRRYNI